MYGKDDGWTDFYAAWEMAEEAACREAFAKQYPRLPVSCSDNCDNGSFGCATCPWKAQATLNLINSKE